MSCPQGQQNKKNGPLHGSGRLAGAVVVASRLLAGRHPASAASRLGFSRFAGLLDDSQPKKAEQPVGYVETEIISVAIEEFVEGRLVDPSVFGDSINAQSTPTGCISQSSGEASCLAAAGL